MQGAALTSLNVEAERNMLILRADVGFVYRQVESKGPLMLRLDQSDQPVRMRYA